MAVDLDVENPETFPYTGQKSGTIKPSAAFSKLRYPVA
jgi:hypothetical protein